MILNAIAEIFLFHFFEIFLADQKHLGIFHGDGKGLVLSFFKYGKLTEKMSFGKDSKRLFPAVRGDFCNLNLSRIV